MYFWKAAVVTTEDNFHRLTKHIHHHQYPSTLTHSHEREKAYPEKNSIQIWLRHFSSLLLHSQSFFPYFPFFPLKRILFSLMRNLVTTVCVFHLQGCYNSSTAQKYEKNYDIYRESEWEIKSLLVFLGKLCCRMIEHRKLPSHFQVICVCTKCSIFENRKNKTKTSELTGKMCRESVWEL